MTSDRPHVVVISSLFPSAAQPGAGLFIRERMFRVARHLPLTVISPTPWFPFQGLIRLFKPHFRPEAPHREMQNGIAILYPRFFCVPGVLKRLDGFFMALGALKPLIALKRAGRLDVLDAHFAYPDGYAAALLGRWLGAPVAITLRGTEARHIRTPALDQRIRHALARADRIFAVAGSLKQVAVSLGIADGKVQVVGNGVDLEKFKAQPRSEARYALGIPPHGRVLVSVGGLVERKGFHRVIECLPALRERFPDLVYLVVGGPSAEGDYSRRLRDQVKALALQDCVRFLGPMNPEDLRVPLSAADVFVLATRNEGWANVFLEAMACGLPVVTTDVGGNREVVCRSELGIVVPFGDRSALQSALDEALGREWDREAIVAHARANAWDDRVSTLVRELSALSSRHAGAPGSVRVKGIC